MNPHVLVNQKGHHLVQSSSDDHARKPRGVSRCKEVATTLLSAISICIRLCACTELGKVHLFSIVRSRMKLACVAVVDGVILAHITRYQGSTMLGIAALCCIAI